jgi:hypothetical protein
VDRPTQGLIELITRSYLQDGNMDEVRYWMVKETAPKPLDHAPGSKFPTRISATSSPALFWNDLVEKLGGIG